jgi:methyltransferase-like protein
MSKQIRNKNFTDRYFSHNKNIYYSLYRDKVIIWDPSNDELLELNSTASFIWNLLDGKHKNEEIIKIISKNFNIPLELAENDFCDFIYYLEGRNLIKKGG